MPPRWYDDYGRSPIVLLLLDFCVGGWPSIFLWRAVEEKICNLLRAAMSSKLSRWRQKEGRRSSLWILECELRWGGGLQFFCVASWDGVSIDSVRCCGIICQVHLKSRLRTRNKTRRVGRSTKKKTPSLITGANIFINTRNGANIAGHWLQVCNRVQADLEDLVFSPNHLAADQERFAVRGSQMVA